MSIKAILSSRKILIGVSAIAIVAAVLIGGTIAYFSDTESSIGNTFQAGKLNLEIDNTCHYNGKVCVCSGEPRTCFWQGTQEACYCTWEAKDLTNELFFNLDDVKPGDSGEDTISLHVVNNPAWLCAEISNLNDYENDCVSPESKVDDTDEELEGELSQHLFFTIWKDNGVNDHACNNILDTDETPILVDHPAQSGIWPIADSTIGQPIGGGDTICYGVKWNVPLSTGNIIQSDSLEGDVIFSAIQARHMDNFKCSDLIPTQCVLTNNGVEICGNGIDEDCSGSDLECEQTGQCTTNADCDDDNACTIEATCDNGVCIRQNLNCSDGNTCTTDTCDPLTGCKSVLTQESCGDAIDNDCDDYIDEEDAIGCKTYLPDADGDGYGQTGMSACLCGPNEIYNIQGFGNDCNDTNPAINPLAIEICSGGVDNDCDGQIDCADSDCSNSQSCQAQLTCAAAESLLCGVPDSGNTTDSGSADIINAYGGTCDNWPETGREYVYSFNPGSVSKNVSVGITNAFVDLDIFVMDSTCAPGSCKVSDGNTANFLAEANKTYYFAVDGNSGAEGSYMITATCQNVCTPTTEVCDGQDNDCDSQIDEDFPEAVFSCDGADSDLCKEGSYLCSAQGGLICSDNTNDTAEICGDGIDNDCDGEIDEGCPLALLFSCSSNTDCEDGNPCTDDTCVSGDCVHTNDNTNTCNDGNACTMYDQCSNGGCIGMPISMNYDFSSCTHETCDNATGYAVTKESAGTVCTDTFSCGMGQGTCNNTGLCNAAGACLAQAPVGCTSNSQCNDSNACTTDTCSSNSCTHSFINCDDGNILTLDSCNPVSGCMHTGCIDYYYDYDGDGYGTDITSCLIVPNGYFRATRTGDCNDGNALANPLTPEICGDFIDNNCNGQIDEGGCDPLYINPITTPPAGCIIDSNCNDDNVGTVDKCVNGSCVNYYPQPDILGMYANINMRFCFLNGCFCWPSSCL